MTNYLSFDIGGTHIKYALMSASGKILEKNHVMSPSNLDDFWSSIDEIILNYRNQIQGVAFSSPGRVDVDKGIIYLGGALTYLDDVHIKERIKQRYNLTAAVVNDGKAAALAEVWQGSLKGVSDGATIVLGTGVGGGLILDGKLRSGLHFQAGELSFMLLNPTNQGFDKMSGSLGSAVNMVKKINQTLGNSNDKDGLSAFKAIQDKEPEALAIFENYCQTIATIILNLHATLDLEIFAIGGGISAQPSLIREINRQYDLILAKDPVTSTVLTRPKIVKTSFGNDANLLGALYQLLN